MESNPPKQTLLLLVGLPASGKSTLSQKLFGTVIEFDAIEQSLKGDQAQFDPVIWQQARSTAHKMCIEAIDRGETLIIMDDNFYYKSMRKPYYQLARDKGIGYLEVYLSVPIEKAIERNSQRSDSCRVPDAVIMSMAGKIQASMYKEKYFSLIDKNDETQLPEIQKRIDKSEIPEPIISEEIKLSEKEVQNYLTKVDQSLRKEVTKLIQDNPQLKEKGKLINQSRVGYFNLIKSMINQTEHQAHKGIIRETIEDLQEIIGNEEEIGRMCEIWSYLECQFV